MKIEPRIVGEYEPDDLEGQGLKIVILSNSLYTYNRLDTLLGVQLSGHTDTLTQASNLIDDLCKRVEISNEQQYLNALDEFRKF